MVEAFSFQTLGKYELLEKLGEGGFGVVYKARDPALDRLVALKVLAPQFTADSQAVERFRQEARLAARLKHPHIVTIYEVGEAAGRYFIAMEWIDGRSLAQRIAAQGALPLGEVVRLVEQVADALDYAHRQGLIHRDIKPANILLDSQGQATLTDFGIVKAMNEAGMTTTGMALGTPEYMAPEQVLGGELDARTDLYALGVVLFHALTGQSPFRGTTPFVIQKAHLEEPPPDPRALNPTLSPAVAAVILKALSKPPEERFQSGAELKQALQQALQVDQEGELRRLDAAARQRYAEGDVTAAIQIWQSILSLQPDFGEVRQRLEAAQNHLEAQQLYRALGEKLNEARQLAERIQSLDKHFPDRQGWLKTMGVTIEAAPSIDIQKEQERTQNTHPKKELLNRLGAYCVMLSIFLFPVYFAYPDTILIGLGLLLLGVILKLKSKNNL